MMCRRRLWTHGRKPLQIHELDGAVGGVCVIQSPPPPSPPPFPLRTRPLPLLFLLAQVITPQPHFLDVCAQLSCGIDQDTQPKGQHQTTGTALTKPPIEDPIPMIIRKKVPKLFSHFSRVIKGFGTVSGVPLEDT